MIFLNSASSATTLVFDLPLCTYTLTPRGNRAMPEFGIYIKIFEKNTIFNEHPLAYQRDITLMKHCLWVVSMSQIEIHAFLINKMPLYSCDNIMSIPQYMLLFPYC